MAQEVIKKMDSWIELNFPDLDNKEWEIFKEGMFSPTFLVGKKHIVKVYVPKWDADRWDDEKYSNWINSAYHPSKEIYDFITNNFNYHDLTPQFYFKDYDKTMQAPILIQDYIDSGTTLSSHFESLNDKEKSLIVLSHADLLKKLHRNTSQGIGTYDTTILRDKLVDKFNKCEVDLTTKQKRFIEQMINNYSPRILVDNISLVHGDAHLSNVIIKDSKLFLIDFDSARFAPVFTEIGAVILSHVLLKKYYQNENNLSVGDDFKSLIKRYPQLMSKKYKKEIDLIVALRIITHINEIGTNHNAKIALKYFFDFEE